MEFHARPYYRCFLFIKKKKYIYYLIIIYNLIN